MSIKRFIFFVTLVLLVLITLSFMTLQRVSQDFKEKLFRVEGKAIQLYVEETWQTLVLNGTNLSPVQPGTFPSEEHVKVSTYIEWFTWMQEMGLNTIRVNAKMPGKFYHALKQFNDATEAPLYLIQGIYFDEIVLKDGYMPLTEVHKKAFEKEIKTTIDSVHGNKTFWSSIYLFETGSVDVSDYLLAYTLGSEWGIDDVAISDLIFEAPLYEGDYFYAKEGATPFENFIAEMMDYAAVYEDRVYLKQSLFTTPSHIGMMYRKLEGHLEFSEVYDEIRSFAVVDVENIGVTKGSETSLFASYDFEGFHVYQSKHTGLANEQILTRLNQYHTVPVVVSAYGVPSARFAGEYAENEPSAAIDEVRQGEITAGQYAMIRESQVAGQFLRDWQDGWFKSSWHTVDLKVMDLSPYWYDPQTYGQGYGVVAFEPLPGQTLYPDDRIDDWLDQQPFLITDQTTYYVNAGINYLTIMEQYAFERNVEDVTVIGFDVTPNSGSQLFPQLDITFDEAVDFVVVLSEAGLQEIFVHAYYDTFTFRRLANQIRVRPDILPYQKDEALFVSMYQFSEYRALFQQDHLIDLEDFRKTGELVKGITHPLDQGFLSTADWYVTQDHLEVRLPYALLNYMSPTSQMIQDDFYQRHRVTPMASSGMKIAFGYGRGDHFTLYPALDFDWPKWVIPETNYRKKRSFDLLKSAFEEK